MGDPILAAGTWPTNAALILDCHRLGYLTDESAVLDPTYGKGNWWTLWRPAQLVAHDLKLDGSDFRHLPYPDGAFQQIAYDPPYVAKGGRETSGIKTMDEAYGQDTCPATPALLQDLINDGLAEMFRLCGLGGRVLVKCQSYVSSGSLWPGAYLTLEHALSLGKTEEVPYQFKVLDILQHVGDPGPQPERTRKDGAPVVQQHARNNYSTMYALRKARWKAPATPKPMPDHPLLNGRQG